ncbi:hypothetical protein IJ098_03100 [Candidatus Saccharibacteria bacterium]|nr:hypothetical protein [Candidatus Saccharibacteria bacterium]
MKREIPNILCFFRVAVSLFLMFLMPNNWFDGVVFSLALISDLFDGYFYRKLEEEERPDHWFNGLPISMDPIADFIFGISGLIIGCRGELVSFWLVVAIVLINLGLSIGLQVVKNDQIWSILANLSTYGWFAVMLLSDYLVWHVAIGHGYWVAFAITVVVFYALLFSFRDESRTIRKRR